MRLTTTALLLTAGAPVSWGAFPASAPAQAGPDSVAEPSSGRLFPVHLSVPGRATVHRLTGVGIRTRTIFKVQVYAFGLYLDSAGAATQLAEWEGKPPRFGKSLRLVMTRDVDGTDMADAFDGALRPRISHWTDSTGVAGGEEALATFRGYFSVDRLRKETELVFSWLPGDTLVTAIGGEAAGVLRDPALAWALFDVYLGEDPVSKDGKKAIVSGIPSLLRRQ
jgi:hypothetical protein